jgi:hypothetical protein
MPLAHGSENLVRWFGFPRGDFTQPFADAGSGFKAIHAVKQSLIRLSILDNDLSLAVYGEDLGFAGFVKAFHVFRGVALEVGEGVSYR